jgi:hypothetical protein
MKFTRSWVRGNAGNRRLVDPEELANYCIARWTKFCIICRRRFFLKGLCCELFSVEVI